MRNQPITIRGVTYPNQRAAAVALSVAQSTVNSAKRRGRLDTVGVGSNNGNAPKPISSKPEIAAPKTMLELMAKMAANENAAARALWRSGAR